jgi:hypothetical protein
MDEDAELLAWTDEELGRAEDAELLGCALDELEWTFDELAWANEELLGCALEELECAVDELEWDAEDEGTMLECTLEELERAEDAELLG